MASEPNSAVRVEHLTMAFGTLVLMRDLNFTIRRGEIFIIIGGSGSGKSTLLRHLIGLEEPAAGEVFYSDRSFTRASSDQRDEMLRRVGVLYQGGALFSSMTLSENVALPLGEYTTLSASEIQRVARVKLELVGLGGFEQFEPSRISGGMQKRAAIARAMALDPEILFLDEPSAGLDPITGRRLDELILELRASLGATVVVVTHELASIYAIGDNCVLLDAATHSQIASGPPRELLVQSRDPRVLEFLTRGGEYRPPEKHHD
jgi:phospholipid/cholesterol/gamma-HCH transport system ATP-binding protein